MVMIASLFAVLRFLCSASTPSNGKLLTKSPFTSRKSVVIKFFASNSRIASPTLILVGDITI